MQLRKILLSLVLLFVLLIYNTSNLPLSAQNNRQITDVYQEWEITAPTGNITYSPDGKYIAVSWSDNAIRLLDVKGFELVKVFKGHDNSVFSVSFSPDGRYLVSGGNDGIRLWRIVYNSD